MSLDNLRENRPAPDRFVLADIPAQYHTCAGIARINEKSSRVVGREHRGFIDDGKESFPRGESGTATGETATVKDIPFARFQVEVADELPAVLSAAGLAIDDVDTAVLTHMHGDHMDGAVHLRGPVLVHDHGGAVR